jgi:hypothetical protein
VHGYLSLDGALVYFTSLNGLGFGVGRRTPVTGLPDHTLTAYVLSSSRTSRLGATSRHAAVSSSRSWSGRTVASRTMTPE